LLEREGFDVITAFDGKEGMKLFSKATVDLVITDIVMPEKEGPELIMELKEG
jgi:YesN/AraC family two-component response regulator